MEYKEDYYKILGVERDANKAEIKAAYKRRAVECHPDKFASASQSVKAQKTREFQLLNEAYSCLYDDKSRRVYNASYTYESTYQSTYESWQSPHQTRRRTSRRYPQSHTKEEPFSLWSVVGLGLAAVFVAIVLGAGRKSVH